MGCYAGITALRTARHIVRSEPGAVVLVVSVELSTLHLSLADEPEPLLAMLQFSDGAAAGIVSAAAGGLELGEGRSLALDDSEELIRWDIRSEEHTSELQSLMRISYAVFCLKKK